MFSPPPRDHSTEIRIIVIRPHQLERSLRISLQCYQPTCSSRKAGNVQSLLIMDSSGHCQVKIFTIGRLLCVLSVLVSSSRGNVLIRPGKGVTLFLQQNLFDFYRCIAAKVINMQSDFESSCFSKVWRTNFLNRLLYCYCLALL